MKLKAMLNDFEVTIVGFLSEFGNGLEPVAIYCGSNKQLRYAEISKFIVID